MADYPARGWSMEPPLPFRTENEAGNPRIEAPTISKNRLVNDVENLLAEVGSRVANRVESIIQETALATFLGDTSGLRLFLAIVARDGFRWSGH